MTNQQQQAVEDDYVPFGYQWEAEALQLTKANLVRMCAKIGIERDKLREERKGLVSKEEMFEFMEKLYTDCKYYPVKIFPDDGEKIIWQDADGKTKTTSQLFEIFKNKP